MTKKVTLNPEWVFSQADTICWADGEGTARISTQSTGNANLIGLTLNILEISYEKEFFMDDHFNAYNRFLFRIETLLKDCPELYHRLEAINRRLIIQKPELEL